MTADTPHLGPAFGAAILFHVGIVAAIFALHASSPAASPLPFHVRLLAAPEADAPAVGVVQSSPAPANPAVPVPKTAQRPIPTKVPSAQARIAPPTPRVASQTTAPVTPAPAIAAPTAASQSSAPAAGADVTDIDTPGQNFSHPEYLANLVNRILAQFGKQSGSDEVTVKFVLLRDGSIRGDNISIVSNTGGYMFGVNAKAAVEAAARANSFGALPADYPNDALVVVFTFKKQ